jgi:oligopeptide transport system substrate-binding protein
MRIFALVMGLALVAGACGSDDDETTSGQGGDTETEGKPVTGGNLIDLQNFGSSGEPDHIDPALSAQVQGSQPGQLIFDGLTETDYKTGELKPMVAESWTSNGDGTVWTFKIRQGVTFSNGDPVVPSDFKYGWERVVKKEMASEVSYHLTDNAKIKGAQDVLDGNATEISGVKADDANMTLTVELDAPLGIFPTVVSHLVFSPINRRTASQVADQTKYEQGIMIGNGPYKMAEPWAHDRYIKLARNDTYWGGINNHKAYIDTIEFRIAKDINAGYTEFESGAGQTGYVPPGKFAEAKAKYGKNISDRPILGVYYYLFNQRDPVVGGPANLKLRQAIALAIDRKAIVDSVYSGARKVATGFTPPGIPGYKEGLSKFPERDLNRARQLLGEWERESGKTAASLPPIKLNFGAGAGHEPVATSIQANLKDIGVKADLDPRDSTTYFSQMRRGEGQFLRSGWFWDYVAYDNGMFPIFHSTAIGGDNMAFYENPRFDGAVDDARRQLEADKAFPTYQTAEDMVLNQDTTVVPLNWYTGQVVYTNQLHNVIQGALGFFAYGEMWLSQ